MRAIAFFVTGATLFLGCAASAHDATRTSAHHGLRVLSVSPYPSLKQRIDELIADSLFPPSNIGIKIFSLERQETLYELNPKMLFNPASNIKLFTAAAAYEVLGTDFAVHTVIYIDTVESPRIILKGFGDPLLSTADLDSITLTLKKLLPPGKEWVLAADVSYFDSVYWGSGWTWNDMGDYYSMPITAVSMNGNAVEVQVRPGQFHGEKVIATVKPATNYVSIENLAMTVSDTAVVPLKVTRDWYRHSNMILVTGQVLGRDSFITNRLSVEQPERYALTLLSERLQNHGLKIKGIQQDTVSSTAREVIRYSHSLDSVVTYMNKVSDNLAAEALLKIISAEANGAPGTTSGGISKIMELLFREGIDTSKIEIADGSGLSRYNLLSPEVVIRLLQIVYERKEYFDVFYKSLPLAGFDGTLSTRMRRTPAEGNLHGKTGTLRGTTSLAGYLRTGDGELIAFSMMMQHHTGSSRPYRAVQDRIGALLARLRRDGL